MKSVNELITARTQAAVRENERIKELISRIVPPAVLPHICFCRLENATLKVTLDNASWVSRLRFCRSQIVDEISVNLKPINDVTWHVLPAEIEPTTRTSKRPHAVRSEASARAVRSVAKTLESGRLKAALLKAAMNLEEGDE